MIIFIEHDLDCDINHKIFHIDSLCIQLIYHHILILYTIISPNVQNSIEYFHYIEQGNFIIVLI